MIDTATPQSPGWWLDRLGKQLMERRDRYEMLQSYYDGTNGIPAHADAVVRESARKLIAMSRTGLGRLAVNVIRARMNPIGFRTGAQNDELGDREAWRIWQGNSLDADHRLIDTTALALSQAYAIVGLIDPETGVPVITPEDPRDVIAETDPARRRRALAAAKFYTDATAGADVAYLYLPGYVVRAITEHREGSMSDFSGWDWDGVQRLPVPVVPVVPFAYQPRIVGLPQAELEPHLSTLDRINFTIVNRLEMMTLQAFRQRAIKGVPTTMPDGTEVDYDDLFRQGPGAIWTLPATADLWESSALDLTPVLSAEKADIQQFAHDSGTPMYMLFPDAAQGSAEGASALREGLYFNVRDRMAQASESYEQMMSIAFRMMGDAQRADRNDLEVIWAPPERYSLSEMASASQQATGVSKRTIQERIWQMTPQEIARDDAEAAAEALLAPEPATLTQVPVGAI